MITYQHESYVRQAIESILAQDTDFLIELVIGDDCSADRTAAICEEFVARDPRVRLLPRERNLGVMANFSRTLQACRGEYIAICEGDDYWCIPDKLQGQIDFLENNPDYGMCYSKVIPYDQLKNRFAWKPIGRSCKTTEELMRRNTIPTLSTCFRRSLYSRYIKEVKPENKDWKMSDYPLWLWISCNSKIYFNNKVTGVYRVLQESASHSVDVVKRVAFLKSSCDIVRYFAFKYNISIGKRYVEFDENRAKSFVGFENLDREMIIEGCTRGGGDLSLKAKICFMLCKTRFSFLLVVLYKKITLGL